MAATALAMPGLKGTILVDPEEVAR